MNRNQLVTGTAGVVAVVLAAAVTAVVARKSDGARAGSADAGTALVASPDASVAIDARAKARPVLGNRAAYIPAQCYAETLDAKGKTHNGCFACHQTSLPPNYADDGDVQTTLSFARLATENRWSHLFAPPPPAPPMSDDALVAWVRTSNYRDDGTLRLARSLAHPRTEWDADGDGAWGGFVPDCWFTFDEGGFDRDPDGKRTGWRAFAYAPMPGMFWPTNGSASDALIRLPEAYRVDADGRESEAIYRVNLAIVEAYVRRVDVPIARTDERALGADLDGDGALGPATRVAFVWPPREERSLHYVGKAAALDPKVEGWPAAGLYPRGTELLHSLRYLDIESGHTRMAARMKELRYMRKSRWLTYGELEVAAEGEAREKRRSPDRLRWVLGDAERGMVTGTGWILQGFIEDKTGELRPQTYEESAACIGCHGGTGATTDSTFSFARKLGADAFRGGWYHWGERGLAGIAEPKRANGEGEYARWLAEVGGGDDFRTNDEVRAKFFHDDGALDPAMRRELARDISVLLVPSPPRALALDRAYLALVQEQRFDQGRDVIVGGAPHARKQASEDEPTGIERPIEASGGVAIAKVRAR